jgi:succinate dehydrogenase/fumarate reductase flavoprotein subunit
MKGNLINYKGNEITVYNMNTAIVGSGAAALNAADRLYTYGQKNIAIVTEGLNRGTSRNTGSDKQTYYKLTLAGAKGDSIFDMAETLFKGGAMDGDIAMVEAALSPQCFYHLVDIGVPFPNNKYGEFVGYKTDHDPRQRATSVGPLTSKYMTEKLEAQIKLKEIEIFDGYQVIAILTDKDKGKALGLLALNLNKLNDEKERFVIFNCTNIIYATGGPAAIYEDSVYPRCHKGASGIAFEAGVIGKNLTESQYGIASIKFRWNLSGTYQQVLPRYISTDEDGSNEKEFLAEYFKDKGKMLDAIFLKGYQWPFDPRKIADFGSSLIDLLVYNETVIKGRKVFLDFKSNPAVMNRIPGKPDFSLLGEEAYNYLKNSKALFGTPIERLKHMNEPAITLFLSHGIDLGKENLEIAVCAQHNNGGLLGNIWWESNIAHLFPVGEVNGSHGVYRPGGSALNSGQVGGTRAAQYISKKYKEEPINLDTLLELSEHILEQKIALCNRFIWNISQKGNVYTIRKASAKIMSKAGAHIRSLEEIDLAIENIKSSLEKLGEITNMTSTKELGEAFSNYDILTTQFIYLSAIKDYIIHGGKSRGSYLVHDEQGELSINSLPNNFKFSLDEGALNDFIQKVQLRDGLLSFTWDKVVPIPIEDNWFENVWKDFRNDNILR